jgi:cytochrome c oxidase assembly protein subunit 11
MAATPLHRRHLRVALLPAGIALSMLGLAFAAVPLYDLFCRVTGFGGTTQVATEAPARLGEQNFTVRFDANTADVPWTFKAERVSETAKSGKVVEARYVIRNESSAPVTGMATYNVTPEAAGAYFNKLQCFCFTEQTLQPGEERIETVVYFVDPAIEGDPNLDGLTTITLSYTFFRREAQQASGAALETGG